MAFQSNPQRGGGQDGVAYIGLETSGMLADSATAIGAMPAMALMGYADSPGEDINENPTDRTGVGSPLPIGPAKPGRKDSSMPGGMLLSGADACKLLIRTALRRDLTIPNSARFECMPLYALATGLAGYCDTALDDQEVGRYCVTENLSIAWADGQDTRLTYTARALSIVGSTAFSAPSESALLAASGDAFNFQESYWSKSFGGVSTGGFDNTLNNATLTISNTVNPAGTRHPDYVNGALLNPVSLIPYFWQIGPQRITLNLNNSARQDYFDALTIINENQNDYLGFNLTGITRATRGRDQMAADARASFPATFMVRSCTLIED